MQNVSNLVIVGAGMAAYTLAREFRKLDHSTAVTIVTADSGDFYSKPMLSNALSQSKNSQTLVTASRDKMAEQINGKVISHALVESIDCAKKTITMEHEQKSINYSHLVLALGASPRQLPLTGNACKEILSINSLDDYKVFEERLKDCQTICIIGSGLIACEFANDLLSTGRKLVVVGASDTPLANLIPREVGEFFQDKLQQQGVQWINSVKAKGLNRHNGQLELTLSNAQTIETDMVISAVGLKARTNMARDAGIETDMGIVVDKFLQTSDSSVYALGDCAQINGSVRAFILPIMHSARALAKTLCGQPTEVKFPPMPVVVKTPAHSVVALSPPANAQGEWYIEEKGNGINAQFKDQQGCLLGYALSGSEVGAKQQLNKELSARFD